MTFEIEEQILKMTLPQKNGHRIKTPSSKLTILVSSYWKKNFIRNNAYTILILSPRFLAIIDRMGCILSGPPCISLILKHIPNEMKIHSRFFWGGGGVCCATQNLKFISFKFLQTLHIHTNYILLF